MPVLDFEGDDKVAQVWIALPRLKAQAAAAKKALDEAVAVIKEAALTETDYTDTYVTNTGVENVEPITIRGYGHAYTLKPKQSFRMDIECIKSERPDIYAAYGKSGVSWELRATK